MKKTLTIIGGIVVLLLVIGLISGGGEEGAAGPKKAETANPAEIVDVTASELGRAYEENEVKAQSQYGGKVLRVTGKIQSISLDFLDEPVIGLRGANEFSLVSVHLEKSDVEKTSELSKGQQLTVTCSELSEVIGSPQLSECVL